MPIPHASAGRGLGQKRAKILTQYFIAKTKSESQLGTFLWGIGNGLAPSMRRLVQLEKCPRVIFSPMRSAPKAGDVSPAKVVRWTVGATLDGEKYELPEGSIVTSRAPYSGGRRHHYALVCCSKSKLEINEAAEIIAFAELRNLLTGRPVGASQVTAVVKRTTAESITSKCQISGSHRAESVYPYFVRLAEPIGLDSRFIDYVRPKFPYSGVQSTLD